MLLHFHIFMNISIINKIQFSQMFLHVKDKIYKI
jgi:hypothetical protein